MKYIKPADHVLQQRAVHPSQRQIHVTPVSAPLYVVTVVYNPQRYQSRYRLYHGFEKHMADSGAILYTVEIALRDRHFQCTEAGNPQHVQLRVESELWYKENGGNVGLSWLPEDWEYVGFVDADFLFSRPDWATETVHMLQHYDAVQMFSNLTYLNSDFQVHNQMKGFAWLHCQGEAVPQEYGHKGAVGGAWAYRRSAIEKLGGLLDVCILGSGDWHMAFALAMRDDVHPEMKFESIPQYVKAIADWRERALDLKGNIGYVDTNAIHYWHGPLKNRGYNTRWRILTENHFDPYLDLSRDWQGLLRLTKHKPKLRDDIRRYFRQRSEDDNSVVV
jgi:hypothetical protein